ncbi:metalloregulator ArsR/SmtB family transcription factor [Microbacterium sp. NPDC076895]|uniref:metalloregulator ArsR/SmtB family transcription factor n=1 Tax=Microbacterium sp. NPDC076895 TaxID=3154957 RepID=UPI0034420812
MDVGTDAALTSLGDPTRARILSLMRSSPDGRVLVGRLATELGLRQPTVSHHMKTLLADAIVIREPEGRQVWYSIAPDAADRVDAILGRPREAASVDLDRIVTDLDARFGERVDAHRIREVVTDSHARLSATDAPLLASRTFSFAASRLDALATASARPSDTTPSVLFVCVQNAGRSQLAAGILRHLAGDTVTVRTAGSAPTADVRSTIVTALDEIGVSIGDEFPKPLTDEAVRAADVVITMGCGDACPIYPGTRYLDWELEDPVGKPLAAVRGIRDDIDRRVRELLAELRSGEKVNTR